MVECMNMSLLIHHQTHWWVRSATISVENLILLDAVVTPIVNLASREWSKQVQSFVQFVIINNLLRCLINKSNEPSEVFTCSVLTRRKDGKVKWMTSLVTFNRTMVVVLKIYLPQHPLQRQYMTSYVKKCLCRKVNCQYCHITGEHQFIEGECKE